MVKIRREVGVFRNSSHYIPRAGLSNWLLDPIGFVVNPADINGLQHYIELGLCP